MEMDEYQKAALRTAGRQEASLAGWSMAAMGLAGEAGEVVDYLKKVLHHGHTLDRDKLTRELGDVMWYVAVLAHINGVALSEVAAENVRKLKARYPNGFSEERSRNRDEDPSLLVNVLKDGV